MCKNDSVAAKFFEDLRNSLTINFSQNLREYDALRPVMEKINKENAEFRGALIEGSSAMIMNRVNGARAAYNSPKKFFLAGMEGYKWGYYFFKNENINHDVRNAGLATLYDNLRKPSLKGILTATVTSANIIGGSCSNAEELMLQRYEQQRNALIISTGLSMGVTRVLKSVGSVMHTDLQKLIFKGVKYSWQTTGMLGLCYGLSRIHDTMHEAGVFGSKLKVYRDDYLQSNPCPPIKFEE